jgi:hypothetical protein
MPKFTEGEWRECDGGIFTYASVPENEKCIAQIEGCGINGKTKCGRVNARLMTQSKKMYEVIKEALEDYDSNDVPEEMDFSWPDKMRNIISSIEEE